MINQNSRYASCILYRETEGDSFGSRQRINTNPRYDDQFHIVIDGDRIDMLAYHYLGDASLWWIICDYNEIFFPLDLEMGQVLRIPAHEYVRMRIL